MNPTNDLFETNRPQTPHVERPVEHTSLRKTKSVPIVYDTKYVANNDSDLEEEITFSSYLNVPKQKKQKKLYVSKSAMGSPASSLLNLFEYKNVLKKLTHTNSSFSKQPSKKATSMKSPETTPLSSPKSILKSRLLPASLMPIPKANLIDQDNNGIVIPLDDEISENKDETIFKKNGIINPKERTRNFVVVQHRGWKV